MIYPCGLSASVNVWPVGASVIWIRRLTDAPESFISAEDSFPEPGLRMRRGFREDV